MSNQEEIEAIFDRIINETHTKRDLSILRQALIVRGNRNRLQLGNNDIEIRQGQDIHIGDRIYHGASANKIWDVISQLLNNEHKGASELQIRSELLAEVKSQVKRWLDTSSHNQVLINLPKEVQPKQVRRPGDESFRGFTKRSYLLPSDTSIMQFFDDESVAGKFLILGEPGSGKTVILLELAMSLITRAENDPTKPIPVVFHLASWENQKIVEWLAAELKYLHHTTNKNTWRFLTKRQILPLIDGLDNLDSKQQVECIDAINKFMESVYLPKHLVICSCISEYKKCSPPLHLNSAICLQPLNELHIQKYLFDINRSDIWQIIENDSEIFDLLKSPLFLFVLTVVYDQISIPKLQNMNSKLEQHRYLFNAYVEEILSNHIEPRSRFYRKAKPEETKRWLSQLAKILREESKTEFLIEKIQLNWLPTRSYKRIHCSIVGLIVGLMIFPICVLMFALMEANNRYENCLVTISKQTSCSLEVIQVEPIALISVLIISIVIGILIGFICPEIKPVENLKWPGSELINALKFVGLKERIMGALMANIRTSPDQMTQFTWILREWIESLLRGLIGAIMPISAPIRGLIRGLRGPDIDIENRNIPNQGIYKSGRNAVFYALIFALIGSLIGIIIALINRDLSQGIDNNQLIPVGIIGLIGGLAGMVLGGLYAGLACIQHFSIRLILCWNGYIPWNYARFLDYATKLRFLQRVGGRYRFIHRLLQKHFSEMELNQK